MHRHQNILLEHSTELMSESLSMMNSKDNGLPPAGICGKRDAENKKRINVVVGFKPSSPSTGAPSSPHRTTVSRCYGILPGLDQTNVQSISD
jgi:hypothetical protein